MQSQIYGARYCYYHLGTKECGEESDHRDEAAFYRAREEIFVNSRRLKAAILDKERVKLLETENIVQVVYSRYIKIT